MNIVFPDWLLSPHFEIVQSSTQFTVMAIMAVVAINRLRLADKQIKRLQRVERANMVLKLDEMMLHHEEVYKKLRHHGEWTRPHSGPATAEDWAALTLYMGLFERINLMIDDGILEIEHFDQLHGYRVQEIINNERIYQTKLEKDAKDWANFLALLGKLKRKPDPAASRRNAPPIE